LESKEYAAQIPVALMTGSRHLLRQLYSLSCHICSPLTMPSGCWWLTAFDWFRQRLIKVDGTFA
jgi:hypothetical protein